jgi:DNA-binding NtrC family response regulator
MNTQSLSPILVASPEIESRRALTSIVNTEGWETVCASGVSECREVIATRNITVVLCDRRLTDGSYRDLLAALGCAKDKVRVIVVSRLADWGEYLEVLHHGGFDLIASPCRPTELLGAIIRARGEEHERTPALSALELPTFVKHPARMARTA